MSSVGAAAQAFAAVFPAELPDKTMVATVVLVTRHHRPLAVWGGAAAAFTLHVVVAVTAGRLLTLLPDLVVTVATVALFAVGAVILWRQADSNAQALATGEVTPPSTARRAFANSFAVIGLAEWGDLTQLATAGVAASTGAPVAAAVGALAALWTVAGIAVVVGRSLVARLPIHTLQRVAAVVFALLAVLTALNR
jgi:putative Ca2+/H+ antiporter (TMEM165/GDT1 family)